MGLLRYWGRFLVFILAGGLAGLLLGLVVEAVTGVRGWGLWLAAAGGVAGLVLFLFTSVETPP